MPDKSSTPTPAPASNQNTLIIIVIAMLAIIALMMFFSMKQNGNVTAPSGVNTEKLIGLRQSVATKEQELKSLGIALPADTSSIDELSSRISRDAMELRTNIEEFQTALSAKEASLTKAQLDLKAAVSMNQSLSDEASKLRSQMAQVQGQQANVAYLRQETDALKVKLAERDKQISGLAGRPTPETVAQFRASLNETMLTNEKLNKKIGDLEVQLVGAMNSSEAERIRAENDGMKLELQKLRAANDYDNLYAKSVDELHPAASRLYKELEKLEGFNPQQLAEAYTLINTQLNNHMVRSVRFKTNSSEVGDKDRSEILDTLTAARPGSFFLVVGYASKTGNKVDNKILSAKRAVAIASIVKDAKNGNTRAVFLGQTDRFSKQAVDNQICEIWEIRK
ncbi:MAG: chromosome segregation ATPase [Crocinitomicaceae bacterium]|jgi:chromosome segregation ATPase